jgi:hypothetical protein
MNMNSKLSWVAAALALAGMASGCASKSVDIGDSDTSVLGASLSDYQGTWVGYVELAEWDDGTQTVRLELDENGDGVLEFGEADPLPPPAADEGYPLSDAPASVLGGPPSGVVSVVSGFSYPVSGAIVESERIRMGSSSRELYREWCELMTPVLQEVGTDVYSCLPNVGSSIDENGCYLGNDEQTPIDCGLFACQHVCECQESGCSINTDVDNIRMDAELEAEGEELEGSFEVPQGRYSIRMTRE